MKGVIVSNKRLNNRYGLMTIHCPEFIANVKAGQFFLIQTQLFDFIYDPLLRRPFGVCDVDAVDGNFTFLYMIIGKGTKSLAETSSGITITFSEPLGNGFTIVKGANVGLVAGGVGIAPLLLLSKTLRDNGNTLDLFYGGGNVEDIVLLDEFRKSVDRVHITTDDGTSGERGMIDLPLKRKINELNKIYSCGPKGMLRSISEIAMSHAISSEVSLDEYMACGIGACLGCVVPVSVNGKARQKRCCSDGPVFDSATLLWKTV
jgi:dihydroorotate dehydrogenase electron transfer subunit